MSIADVHRDETIAYVLGLVRGLHNSEAARVTLYSRQPHAIALEHIARERAARLGQLVVAIEAGLFDQLDASATGGIEDESLLPWERELLARTDVENLTAKEKAIRAAAWAADAAAEDEAAARVEHFDQAKADDVRAIRREMAIEAGDDSEALRQEAEDDARHERAIYLAEREAEAAAERYADDENGGEF